MVALRLRPALFFFVAVAAGIHSGGDAPPLQTDAAGAAGAPGGASSATSVEELRDVVRGLAGSVSSLETQVHRLSGERDELSGRVGVACV